MFAYRTHPHGTTNETPYFAWHGRDARLPTDMFVGISPRDVNPDDVVYEEEAAAVERIEAETNILIEGNAESNRKREGLPRISVAQFVSIEQFKDKCCKHLYGYTKEDQPLWMMLRDIFERHDLDVLCLVYDPKMKSKVSPFPNCIYLRDGSRADLRDAVYRLSPEKENGFDERMGKVPVSRLVAVYSRTNSLEIGPSPEDLEYNDGRPVVTLGREQGVGVVKCTYRSYEREEYLDKTVSLVDPRRRDLHLFGAEPLWDKAGKFWIINSPEYSVGVKSTETFVFEESRGNIFEVFVDEEAGEEVELEETVDRPVVDTGKLKDDERRKLFMKYILKGLHAAQSVIKEKVAKAKEALREKSLENDRAPHTFEIGDRAWLAVPLESEMQRLKAPKKFIFRWVGPVRIMDQSKGDSGTLFRVVETFPGGEVVQREAHVSRLRPYVHRRPIESAERAVRQVSKEEELKAEIAAWKKQGRILTRRPLYSHEPLFATHPSLRRKMEEYDHTEDTDPLHKILAITHVGREGTGFFYVVKLKGVRELQMHTDDTLPEETLKIFWGYQKQIKSRAYTVYRKWIDDRYKGVDDLPRDIVPDDEFLLGPVTVGTYITKAAAELKRTEKRRKQVEGQGGGQNQRPRRSSRLGGEQTQEEE
ncbi:hypothetical protein HDU99_000410 [Rhizoclosmatium hyalinum]|nr:hypothetical protein HDU99_000410 [Rhizoclosmatium hyalinum]